MWSFDQAKFASTLVEKGPYQNEVIDLGNNFFKKDYNIKSATFQTYSNKFYPKRANILFVNQFYIEFWILIF
jgi:hypothetical protein